MTERLKGSGGAVPTAAQMFLLQVSVRRDGSVFGMLRTLYHEKAMHFTGIDQAVLMINEWMNLEDVSSGELDFRTFTGERISYWDNGSNAGISDAGGVGSRQYQEIAVRRTESFLVHVVCRQNTSWQGEVRWNGQRCCFRSGLELISLVRSALDRTAAKVSVRSSAARNLSETASGLRQDQLAAG